ncbi:Nramp family divalent metal transporter [Pseudonocardia dioxanivorans]|uniref:Nramp family divalent metal transporter n=1 Tax=Pseudonocardia dioxanivorans TaxID=240495 RepID=UPI00131A51DD|nr:Nramp family divalent metal transporter [Pseudonocardia dioxanivorans]
MAVSDSNSAEVRRAEGGVAPPRRWQDYAKGVGPGLLVSMAWMGAGDLIDSAVSGANYGYSLMWALALALISRYFFTSAIAKYGLCNSVGDETVIAGFGALWSKLPVIVGSLALLSGFILQTYMIVAVGAALHRIFLGFGGDTWGPFLWTLLVAAMAWLVLTRPKAYSILEIIARIKVAILVITFLYAAIASRPDPGEIVRGLAFSHPPNTGAFATLLVAAALIGAVGGSAGNLMYPEFIRDKGWRGPGFLRMQRLDLLSGVIAVIVVNLSIWIVAAEVLRPEGLQISSLDDFSVMMSLALGPIGPWLLWIGLAMAAFCSLTSYARGYTKIFFSGLRRSFPTLNERYPQVDRTNPFRAVQIGFMICVPVLFALPGLPDAVVMTVAGSATAGLMAPVIIVGTLILTNDKRRMLPGYANKWWENIILVVVGCIGLWSAYGLIVGLPELLG